MIDAIEQEITSILDEYGIQSQHLSWTHATPITSAYAEIDNSVALLYIEKEVTGGDQNTCIRHLQNIIDHDRTDALLIFATPEGRGNFVELCESVNFGVSVDVFDVGSKGSPASVTIEGHESAIPVQEGLNQYANQDAYEIIDLLQTQLIDLTRRNKLISFTTAKDTIVVVKETPNGLFTILVEDRKSMKLDPWWDLIDESPPKQPDLLDALTNQGSSNFGTRAQDIDRNLASSKDARPEYFDEAIQTAHSPKRLQTIAGKTYTNARRIMRTTGTNQLYLAIGFLCWYDKPESEIEARAPLILIPLTMERVKKTVEEPILPGDVDYDANEPKQTRRVPRFVYTVDYTDEEIMPNVALKLLLDQNFDLPLPDDFAAFNEEGKQPEDYLATVSSWASGYNADKRWRVDHHAAIGFFDFAQAWMYEDLSDSCWKNKDCSAIDTIFGGKHTEPLSSIPTEAIEESEANFDIPLVCPADTSQYKVIMHALRGRSLVVQGPPGTGKSQTIANIIAAFLHEGKRVLFLAAKETALSVVAKRLEDAGLGSFLLSMHADGKNAGLNAIDIADAIKERKDAFSDWRGIDQSELRQLHSAVDRQRKKLNDVARQLATKDPRTSLTLSRMLWEANMAWEIYEAESKLHNQDTQVLPVDGALRKYGLYDVVEEARDFVLRMKDLEEDGDLDPNSEWRGLVANNLTDELVDEIISQAKRLQERWEEFESHGSPEAFPSEKRSTSNLLNWAEAINGIDVPEWEYEMMGSESLLLEDPDCATQAMSDLILKLDQWQRLDAQLNIPIERLPNPTKLDELIVSRDSLIKDHSTWRNAGNQLLLEDIRQRLIRIRRVVDAINSAPDVLQNVPADADNMSVAAMREWLELIAVINNPDGVSWDMFSTSLASQEASELVTSLREKTNDATVERKTLEEIIDIKCLPDDSVVSVQKTMLRENSWWSRHCGNHKKAFKAARVYFHCQVKSGNEVLGYLNRVHELVQCEQQVDNHGKATELFGSLFRGRETNWQLIAQAISCIKTIVDIGGIRRLPVVLENDPPHANPELLADAGDVFCDLKTLVDGHVQFADYHLTHLSAMRWCELPELLTKAIEDIEKLVEWYDTVPWEPWREVPFGQIGSTLETARDLAELRQSLPQHESRTALGSLFNGLDTNSHTIQDVIDVTATLRNLLSMLQEADVCRQYLATTPWKQCLRTLKDWGKATDDIVKGILRIEEVLGETGAIRHGDPFQPSKCTLLIEEWKSAMAERVSNPRGLRQWQELTVRLQSGETLGCKPLIDSVLTGNVPLDYLQIAFEASARRKYAEQFAKDNGINLEELLERHLGRRRQEFQQSDQRRLDIIPKQIVGRLRSVKELSEGKSGSRIGDKYGMDLIRHATGKKRTRITVRDLMHRSFKTIQAYKPCWLVSPGSTSQYLQRTNDLFDVLIVDEASQLRTAEIAPAALRCKKMLIFGDTKQMPPSHFAKRTASNDSEDYEIGESVLERAAMAMPTIRLEWHYRSQHEDLIRYSNYHFYNNNLVVFPSRTPGAGDLGLRYNYVGGYYVGHRNKTEAEKAAEMICEHILSEAHKPIEDRYTVGAVAMNIEQRDLILELIDRKRTDNSVIDKALRESEHSEEPFFVTNLENVQGDERDHIVISCTYGPEAEGLKPKNNFGPINNQGGERRLNVLYTRSRRMMTVLSSIHDHEITSQSSGSRHFRGFLEYARSGNIVDHGQGVSGQAENVFEETVGRALQDAGYKVSYQVGVKGYYIDIAVHDPSAEGHFVMAIECDGATYHSSRTARERDRLRQEILEHAGWHFYRVWSTDWFVDRERTTRRMLEAVRSRIDATRRQERILESAAATMRKQFEERSQEIEDEETDIDDSGQNILTETEISKQGPEAFELMRDSEQKLMQFPVSMQTPSNTHSAGGVDGGDGHPSNVTSDKVEGDSLDQMAPEQVRGVTLNPYLEYNGHACFDPRTSSSAIVGRGLRKIIEAEGPMVAKRAYDIYLRGCGIQRMGREIRSLMNEALQGEITANRVISETEADGNNLTLAAVRLADQAPVVVRERGSRTLEEIPLSEIARVAFLVAKHEPRVKLQSEDHMRAVLEVCQIRKLTTKARDRLSKAIGLSQGLT